jgi:predicted ATP-binding protein involved in virulence
MQRSILRRLVDAFPKAQFIVVTHSPFVVSSMRDSFVFALAHAEVDTTANSEFATNQVSSIRLDLDSKAATASEILRDVLGVPVTLPEWAETDLLKITEQFSHRPITEANINSLKEALKSAGLSEYLPDALKVIAG